ncbi:uncharacterized protein LOC122297734 isoform X3 [Carya illinoinensis]|uniref:uncharacterized protein LOC122297734 isoform X3 n=2 Tax=Carya illinoinensis TaxID=32201 RepID=UPI001C71B57C|nr:uncharacterized protein LOC122297734 isoform X3 [Carya illinoinensis]
MDGMESCIPGFYINDLKHINMRRVKGEKSNMPEQILEIKMMGKANRERLAEYLGELQRKEDTNDRYVAALRGETLTRNPYVRIQPIPKPSNTGAEKEQKAEK